MTKLTAKQLCGDEPIPGRGEVKSIFHSRDYKDMKVYEVTVTDEERGEQWSAEYVAPPGQDASVRRHDVVEYDYYHYNVYKKIKRLRKAVINS